MKALNFIYQDTHIHFLLNPLDKNVMVNATEMAKLFNKRLDHFLKAEHTQNYIKILEKKLNEFTPYGGNSEENKSHEFTPYGVNSDIKIIESRGHMGTYFHRKLAIKFAMWLDDDFFDWVIDTLDEILFGKNNKIAKTLAVKNDKIEELKTLKEEALKSNNETALKILKAQVELEIIKREEQKAVKELKTQLRLF